MNIKAMQDQAELTAEQKYVFFGQVIKAIDDLMADQGQPPDKMKIHPRLFEQLFPAEVRWNPHIPKQCFTIPIEPEAGVPYGTFVVENKKAGIIRGH